MRAPDAQARHWSRHAGHYDAVFLDPFSEGVVNPFLQALGAIPSKQTKSVIDLGCGTGPLLQILIDKFQKVTALDFAPGMIEKAKDRLGDAASRVEFLLRPMHDLESLAGKMDAAVAVNSLVMPDPRVIDQTLSAIHAVLKGKGWFLGVVPAIDAIQYQTLLLHERALEQGMELRDADRLAAEQAEHALYDFGFGRFSFQGLKQNFWQPFEIEHRLAKAGFREVKLEKLLYPWDDNLPCGREFTSLPRSWDWTFVARA